MTVLMTVLTVVGVAAQFALIWRIRTTHRALAEDRGPHRNEVGQSAPS